MTAVTETAAVPQPLRRRARPRITVSGETVALFSFFLASVLLLVFVSQPYRLVIAPALAVTNFAALYVLTLLRRDGRLPICEVASLWIAATFFYSVYPILNFVAGGLRWYPVSDFRLQYYNPGPTEFGTFAWRYVVYFGSFVLFYLPLRGRARITTTEVIPPSRTRIIALAILAAACFLLLFMVGRLYNISYNPRTADVVSGAVRTMLNLPLAVVQVVHNVWSIFLLLMQIGIALLMRKWHDWRYRFLLIGSLGVLVASTILRKTARTETVLMMLTAIILYDRMVRPLRLRQMIPIGALLLGGFLFAGILRDLQGLGGIRKNETPALATANEFSAVFGTGFDLYKRREAGTLPHVPWQIYVSDFYYVIPSQLLPFEKMDPSIWYLRVIGVPDVGFMFGVIAQAVVGLDWIELFLRGAMLAAMFAFVHRWYCARQQSFWRTMFVVFIAVWTYYTIRQSSLAWVYYVVYWFVPTYVAVEVIALLLRRTGKSGGISAT